ncbi:LysR family transcriptional regulator [Aestuariirhabdus sp. Z084]|uniref:LysR family transcriptional regulator n=1 Tax=Aestuariirhabdus haliotis TaxID=2918751 RepID=UPI00201B3AEE|nr:LysR family transcriptional regulator [Aestuariirhabdus haliotis]MCL6417623.1 LysR family transcriptional regulator [Aestuariirhabdus haliotis]MCL6421549.1 LysR family transcriptional regulator [Aestuariirhabdus haliotis]
MDRLQAMGIFVAVAETESFSAAARRLGISPPAVTRAVAGLEAHLGTKLLNRTTRFVRVTEAGQRYLEACRRIIAEADEADEIATGIHAEPRGHLAVTAPVMFGRLHVMPGIVEYLRRYPDMEVSALFVDRVVNLLEEGQDVGIRIGELPDSNMKARRVGNIRRVLCAAPGYLSRQGIPKTPSALQHHSLVVASAVSPTVEWSFADRQKSISVRTRPRLQVSSNDGAIAAAVAGLGITRLLSYQIAPQLAAGELEIILADYETRGLPVHIVHREGRYTSAKVRAFVDLMVDQLQTNLPENTSSI